MSGLLPNKVVCITGASRGIGRACAVESANQGALGLILHYLGDKETQAEIQALKEEIETRYPNARVAVVPGDIADPATSTTIVEAGVAAFGRIDVLVSNAGICPFAEFLTMPHATWQRTRAVNLDGSFYIVQAVANQMKSQTPQGGSIIGVSSISALVGGEFQWHVPFQTSLRTKNRPAFSSHYTPTKAGILSLMQSCALALGKYNIRANAVLPGTIATDINKEDLSNTAKRDYMVGRTALGRLGAPEDIAGPVVFLASDLAKYVTGAPLLVDGGLFVNLQ
ncbi:NAD(P)-binding protein [Laetiporus sulphureus 93-53]|uniref:NAD(P)-binding protein n=1 Tax=Laetiporus sulphureus 93-53 TaxID=1314785 RepID=A0A165CEA8_9APHY|nr:NAD(P)-binding protein [Laetiporus sulphureus 93-53]KZT02657.1 NAD(P)-binding protein [Laetiporus sulphureus 93-53]